MADLKLFLSLFWPVKISEWVKPEICRNQQVTSIMALNANSIDTYKKASVNRLFGPKYEYVK